MSCGVCTDDASVETAVETATTELQEQALEVTVFQMEESENTDAIMRHISAKRLRAVRAYTEAFGGTLDENMAALQGISSDDIYKKVHAAQRQNAPVTDAHEESCAGAGTGTACAAHRYNGCSDAGTSGRNRTSEATQKERNQNPNTPCQKAACAPSAPTRTCLGERWKKNAAALKGVSSKEIYAMIDAERSRREESQKEGINDETNPE